MTTKERCSQEKGPEELRAMEDHLLLPQLDLSLPQGQVQVQMQMQKHINKILDSSGVLTFSLSLSLSVSLMSLN
jgi:hypothetical protein